MFLVHVEGNYHKEDNIDYLKENGYGISILPVGPDEFLCYGGTVNFVPQSDVKIIKMKSELMDDYIPLCEIKKGSLVKGGRKV